MGRSSWARFRGNVMPLIIEGGRVPPRWAERKSCRPEGSGESYGAGADCVRIAFLNNMPDAALEDTEIQFFELLDAASGEIAVRLKLHSLSGVPRGEQGKRHLDSFYFSTDDLLNTQVDAVIMTGTEPRQANLRDEPYWPALTGVLDWAENNTVSTILSCLAAHAGVLHSDGVSRHLLSDKQFGVFDFSKAANHQLTAGYGERVCFPHSRWNEVRADELTACGYRVLTQSSEGGVDSFVKNKKRSLFVHFQGHPEYGAQTLLKEYRRDVKRFLRAERETYPSMPKGYFSATATKLLADFRDIALSDRREERMQSFPEAVLVGDLKSTWSSSAMSIYRNWLLHLASNRAEATAFPAVAVSHDSSPRKRSALR
jgi:homoserine O-succinyltransferase/O-acetyltransferase